MVDSGAEATRSSARTVELLTEGVIEAGWLVALAVIPLLFNPYSRQSFEPDKAGLLRVIALVMAVAWLAKVATGSRWWRPVVDSDAASGSESASASEPRLPLLLAVPVVLILVSSVVATVVSVDPMRSWWGSYHRGQGLVTELAYFVVFGLVLGHLRDRQQWRRIAFAVIVTSVPIATYALLQAQGADPVPWATSRRRVGSTMGNPIFLGAYLVTAVFVTLHELCARVGSLVAPGRGASKADRRVLRLEMLQAGMLLYVLVLQAAALVLTESRGPMLGVLAGGYTFALIGLLLVRPAVSGDARYPRWLQAVAGHGWLAVLATGLAGVLFLAAFNVPGTPLAPLREVPYLGRLGTVFDLSSNSTQVRLLTWRGTLDLLRSSQPLAAPGAEPDPLHRLRPIVGYGPENLSLAIARFQPPEMARFGRRGEVPDRAHNETFQRLVTGGVFGYLSWLALYCGVFFFSLRWLGLVDSRARATWFWAAVIGGGTVGGTLPVVITGSGEMAGVGLPAGLVAGLLTFVTVSSLRRRTGRRPLAFREGVVLAVLATVIGHFVEIHFGIAITSTRLYMWLLTAALIAVGQGWVADRPNGTGASAGGTSRRGAGRADGSRELRWLRWQGAVAGLITAAVMVTAIYGLLGNRDGASRAAAVVGSALSGSATASGGGLLWILLFTWVVAALLAVAAGLPSETSSRPLRSFAVASIVPTVVVCGLHAARLAATARIQLSGADPMQATDHVSYHVTCFAVAVMLVMLITGGVLAAGSSPGEGSSGVRTTSLAAAAIAATAVAAAIAGTTELRAETFVKHGQAFAKAGRTALGLRLIDRGIELDRREAMHLLALGTTATDAARDDPDERDRLHATARRSFEAARELAPLDPDHTQNLARMWAQRGLLEQDGNLRADHLRHAEREYRAAIAMRPSSVRLVMELVGILQTLGDRGEAIELAERAVEMAPWDLGASLRLAVLYREQARRAVESGNRRGAADLFDRGLAVLEQVRSYHPESAEAAKAEAGLLALAGRTGEALAAYDDLMGRFGEDSDTHRVLALLHAERGDHAEAIRHAERAVLLADDSQRAAAGRVLARVMAAAQNENR